VSSSNTSKLGHPTSSPPPAYLGGGGGGGDVDTPMATDDYTF